LVHQEVDFDDLGFAAIPPVFNNPSLARHKKSPMNGCKMQFHSIMASVPD
jgi:hypothetical protein